MEAVTIYVIHRSGEWKESTSDFWTGFHDDLNKPGAWGGGRNPDEAIGSLIRCNPERVVGGIKEIVYLDRCGRRTRGE